jgi:tetratricopeptide (TPR) repeat protein
MNKTSIIPINISRALFLFMATLICVFMSSCQYFESEQARLQKAKMLYDENKFNESIILAKKILQSDVNNCEARILLGQDQFAKFSLIDAQDSFAKAKNQGCKSLPLFYFSVKTLMYRDKFAEIKTLYADPHFGFAVNEPESIRLEGDLYFLQKNYEKAEELYAKYNDTTHDVAANCLSQIKLSAMKDDYEGVIQKSTSCEKLYSEGQGFDINQSRYLRAIAQVHMKQDSAAETTLNTLLESYSNIKDPNIKIQSLFLLMKLYIAKKEVDNASKMADALLKYIAVPDIYYIKGLKAEHDNKFDIAEQQFLMALKLNPKHASSLLELANINYKEGNIEQAKFYTGKVDALTGNSTFTDRLDEVLAIKYLQAGDLDAIIKNLPNDENSGSAKSKYILALAYAKKGDSVNAWKEFHNVEKKLANTEKTELLKARLYTAFGDLKSAEEIYNKYVKRGSDYASLALSRLYIQERKYENAEPLLTRLLQKPANTYSATLLLVELYSAINQKNKMISLLRKNINSDTNNSIYWILLAKVYFKYAMYQEAIDACDNVLNKDPRNIEGYAIKANAYIRQGKDKQANEVFNDLIKHDANNAYAYFMLAYLANRKSNHEAAITYLNKALEINPQYMNAIYAKIDLLVNNKQASEALAFAKSTASAFKEKQTANILLGVVYEKLGDAKNAYLNYLDALNNGNNDINVAIKMYKMSVSINGEDKAGKEFDKWLDKHQDLQNLNYAANFFMGRHVNSMAEKYYELYITKDHRNPVVYNNLAWLNLERGKNQDALAYANTALALAPDSPAIMDTVGLILLKTRDYDKAGSYLLSAYQKLNTNPGVKYHLALFYYHKNNFEKSRSLLLEIKNVKFAEQADAQKLLVEVNKHNK